MPTGVATGAAAAAFRGVLAEATRPPPLDGTLEKDELAWLDAPAVADPDLARIGTRVGPYLLEEMIGRGGMGAVYRATRADGEFKQRVALKLVRPAAGPADLAQRFRREREILARLNHPNIARLLDGGLSGDGALFYAMELIDGETLDAWCERKHPSLPERLDLFLQVCAALSYAHQNLVVHRDLKPSNLLVTADGSVRLLDFGIAKLLDTDASAGEDAALTLAGDRVLTPSYAAPEQVLGQAITTATDVYALGLVLSELLTGVRAQQPDGRSMLDAENVIVRVEAMSPSAAVLGRLRSAPGTPGPGLRFGIDASTAWARQLRGDLDAIVLKALRKDPARRYPSVALLAADVQAHLDGRPVDAARGAFAYRAGKFVRRHRVAVVGGALLLLAIIAGVAAVAWQAQRAARQAARAEQVKSYVLALFRGVDPQLAQGHEITARELLDRGIDNLRRDLSEQPDIKAELLEQLGDLYLQINHRDEGARLLEEALALRRGLLARGDPALLPALLGLARAHVQRSRYEDARPLLTEADGILAPGDERLDDLRTDAAELWVTVHVRTGEMATAEATAVANENLQLTRFGADDEHYAAALAMHAWIHTWSSRYRDSERLLQRALAIHLRKGGPQGPLARGDYVLLGNLAYYRGDFARSRDLFSKALEIAQRVYGPEHARSVSDRGYLARAIGASSEVAEGETRLRAVVEEFRKPLNQGWVERPFHTSNLALLLAARGKFGEAIALQEEATRQINAASGERAKITLYFRRDLGTLLASAGQAGPAIDLLREARAGLVAFEGESGMQVARTDIGLADALRQKGESAEASRLLAHARPILVEEFGEQSEQIAVLDLTAAHVALASSRPADAVELLKRVVAIRTALFGAADLRSAEPAFLLGRALYAQADATGKAQADAAARRIVAAPGNEGPLRDESARWLAGPQ